MIFYFCDVFEGSYNPPHCYEKQYTEEYDPSKNIFIVVKLKNIVYRKCMIIKHIIIKQNASRKNWGKLFSNIIYGVGAAVVVVAR